MSDYARIADAIRFIASQVERQPTLDEIAAHVHLSPFHFQRLFSRWAGVTPKRYLQVLTLERAKALLQESRPLLEVADTLGLSSGSRLYDHFVQLEAVTPGEYKQRGAGLVIDHGVHDTPFGQAFVALTPRGVCNFSFLDDKAPEAPLADLARSWPAARLQEAPSRTQGVIHTMFDGSKAPDRPISLHVSG
ncbi:MAG: helix-turn-helix domain-containing protein, partial [Aeromonas veronii]